MNKNTEIAMLLGQLALDFGRVNRVTLHEDGQLLESDTTHTVMLSLIACALCPPHLDRGQVAQLALVHDLVEAKVGDTNSFDISADDKAAKDKREQAAMEELKTEFADCQWLTYYLWEYEQQNVPEARFVRYLDKAMPKITHALNGCSAIKSMGKNKDDLIRAHGEQFLKLANEYPEFKKTRTDRVLWDLMLLSEEAYGEAG